MRPPAALCTAIGDSLAFLARFPRFYPQALRSSASAARRPPRASPPDVREGPVALVAALPRCVLGLWLGLACTAPTLAAGVGSVRTYYGLCDASAAAILDADHFAVGDDEDNIIRVYHRRAGVLPVFSLDVSPFLEADPENPEADLEGAARLGDWIYWITSHGRNRKGEDSPGRQRFFAVAGSVRDGLARLDPVGMPYKRLLDDLLADPRLERFDLAAAA